MIERPLAADALPILPTPNAFLPNFFRALPTPSPLSLAQLKAFVEQEFAQIKHVLHGISLLGQCPDSVNAALICRGESSPSPSWRVCWKPVDIKSVSLTRSKLLAVGHYLESTRYRIHPPHCRQPDPDHDPDGRVYRRQ